MNSVKLTGSVGLPLYYCLFTPSVLSIVLFSEHKSHNLARKQAEFYLLTSKVWMYLLQFKVQGKVIEE